MPTIYLHSIYSTVCVLLLLASKSAAVHQDQADALRHLPDCGTECVSQTCPQDPTISSCLCENGNNNILKSTYTTCVRSRCSNFSGDLTLRIVSVYCRLVNSDTESPPPQQQQPTVTTPPPPPPRNTPTPRPSTPPPPPPPPQSNEDFFQRLPTCGASCIRDSWDNAVCARYDWRCICSAPAYLASRANGDCLSACGEPQHEDSLNILNEICEGFGVPISLQTAAANPPPPPPPPAGTSASSVVAMTPIITSMSGSIQTIMPTTSVFMTPMSMPEFPSIVPAPTSTPPDIDDDDDDDGGREEEESDEGEAPQKQDKSPVPIGAIIGSVTGGVLGTCLIVTSWIMRRRSKKKNLGKKSFFE